MNDELMVAPSQESSTAQFGSKPEQIIFCTGGDQTFTGIVGSAHRGRFRTA